jgi:hypothetical protein
MSEVKELIKLMVELGNEYKDEILQLFDEDISKYSLALIIRDSDDRYGFLLKHGRLQMVEGEDADRVIATATATIITTSNFLVRLINSDDWERIARFGYNVGEVHLIASDRRNFKHAKNLIKLVKFLNELVVGE